MPTVEHKAKRISTLKENTKCIDNSEHQIEPFIYQGIESYFESVCRVCGDFDINPKGLHSHLGLAHYLVSKRYKALLDYSALIKSRLESKTNQSKLESKTD